MEVNQERYRKELLSILRHISNASFVSFDLEMSGIHKNLRFGPKAGGHDKGKPSLQQLYEETRIAAETFQVLQVGITCVEENREKEFYLARPYNFNLSPLFFLDNRVKDRFPERNIVFSSSATDFLQGEGFNIGKVFSEGVFYLSHAEEEETNKRFLFRNDRDNNKPDAIIPPGDTKALDFYRQARTTISTWVNAKKQDYPFVNIGDPTGDLNGYQRLLVHQLVKKEFPGYRSFARGKQSFIQVEKANLKKDAEEKTKKLNDFNYAVAKQIGLRWIFEALSGGDLSGIPTTWFSDETEKNPELGQHVVNKEFEKVKADLKKKDHVIVGHNLFTDLICLYVTFVGPLPKLVKDFQDRIHSLFPIIFDTKYLATEGHNSMSTVMRQGLSELLQPFKNLHTPLVVLHEKYNSYGAGIGKKHEAGFDSWMTAELFVKLSAKVHAERMKHEKFDSDTSVGTLSYVLPHDYSTSPISISEDESVGGARLYAKDSDVDLLDLSADADTDTPSTTMSDYQPSKWHEARLQKLTLNDANPYSVLANIGEGPSSSEVSSGREGGKAEQWVPNMYSSFWNLYANKLRVNACEGGICDLNENSD